MVGRERRVPDIGDILEVETSGGLAYLQLTHRHPKGEEVVRVLPGVFAERPSDLSSLAVDRERYVVITPVRAAVREGMMRIAGHAIVPHWATTFPLFKWWLPRVGERPGVWRIWNGSRILRVASELPPELQRLPTRSSIMPLTLTDRITEGWSPVDDYTTAESTSGAPVARSVSTRHYLYFQTQTDALGAEAAMLNAGMRTEAREADGKWLVVALDDGVGRLSELAMRVAEEHDGDYDGVEHVTT